MKNIGVLQTAILIAISTLVSPASAAAPVALRCNLKAGEPTPPMFVTFTPGSGVVQVTMAGQTAFHDTLEDGSILWWQFKGQDGVIVRTRLNRVDGSIVITNEHPFDKSKGGMLKGMCELARNKF